MAHFRVEEVADGIFGVVVTVAMFTTRDRAQAERVARAMEPQTAGEAERPGGLTATELAKLHEARDREKLERLRSGDPTVFIDDAEEARRLDVLAKKDLADHERAERERTIRENQSNFAKAATPMNARERAEQTCEPVQGPFIPDDLSHADVGMRDMPSEPIVGGSAKPRDGTDR